MDFGISLPLPIAQQPKSSNAPHLNTTSAAASTVTEQNQRSATTSLLSNSDSSSSPSSSSSSSSSSSPFVSSSASLVREPFQWPSRHDQSTHETLACGTRMYSSPEQTRRHAALDGRSG